MSALSIICIALAMSMDAFVAAIGKGAGLKKPRFTQALKTGVLFGAIEAATPLVGWAMGQAAVDIASEWSHWIAFALLLGLGLHMIYQSLQPTAHTEDSKPDSHAPWLLALTALATSIDALAVGVGLAFVKVNILLAASAIGIATLTMVTAGVMLGRAIGTAVGRRAETLGGMVLIVVGAGIVYQHHPI